MVGWLVGWLVGIYSKSYISTHAPFAFPDQRLRYTYIYMGGVCKHIYIYMGVSKNNGTPKSSILIGFSIINHPFWDTPIFGNTHIYIFTCIIHGGDEHLYMFNIYKLLFSPLLPELTTTAM